MEHDTAIRQYRFAFPQTDLDDLKRRILSTRWSEKETVADFSQGTPLAILQELAGYWAESYDWRNIEEKINSFPQFQTDIDGVDIYFIHVRSKVPNALPLLITHGRPASITHQLQLIGPLTDPESFGGTAFSRTSFTWRLALMKCAQRFVASRTITANFKN